MILLPVTGLLVGGHACLSLLHECRSLFLSMCARLSILITLSLWIYAVSFEMHFCHTIIDDELHFPYQCPEHGNLRHRFLLFTEEFLFSELWISVMFFDCLFVFFLKKTQLQEWRKLWKEFIFYLAFSLCYFSNVCSTLLSLKYKR